jgi:hypothetical protein
MTGSDAEDRLQLVDLHWISRMMGDKTERATRRYLERLRAKGILLPVPLPGSRLRWKRIEVEALLLGRTPFVA